MCCATVTLYQSDNTVDYTKMCMDAMVADANVGMWMDDFYFTVECDSDNQWGSNNIRSGATSLTAAGTAALAMVASTLF